MDRKINTKVMCANCCTKADKRSVKAMIKAGFGLNHLACTECGQQQLREIDDQQYTVIPKA